MKVKKVGCKVCVEKEMVEKNIGRKTAKNELCKKVAKLMHKEGNFKYKITEIDIDENYGFERSENVKLDDFGEEYLQEYIIYKCFAKVEYRLKGELLK